MTTMRTGSAGGRRVRRDGVDRRVGPSSPTGRSTGGLASSEMPEAPVTPDDVRRAAEVIRGRVHRTPTFTSRSLGPGQHLKAELFQRTGSFKARGALNRVRSLSAEERARGVISVSAGNHAQALAWAAATEEIDALLVMWQGASEAKIEATRAYGATVDLEAEGPGRGVRRLRELEAETGRVFVHPFDDPVVIAGAGTVGLEILEDVTAWRPSSSRAAAAGSCRGSPRSACPRACASSPSSRSGRTRSRSASRRASRSP